MKLCSALCTLLVSLLMLTGCDTSGFYIGGVVLEGEHTLSAPLDGSMLVMDGTLQLEAPLSGDLVVVSGRATLKERIRGDVVVIGGEVAFESGSTVKGDVIQSGGTLLTPENAVVEGDIRMAAAADLPDVTRPAPMQLVIGVIVQATALMTLLGMLYKVAPRSLHRMERALSGYPIVAVALGLLTFLVLPVLMVTMAFTVILLPVSLIGLLLAGVFVVGSGLAFGMWLGRLAASALKREMGLRFVLVGAVVYVITLNLMRFIPVVGDLLRILVVATGTGAVLLTRFGLTTYTPPDETWLDANSTP